MVALVLVAAVAENGVIGRDGAIPWHLPPDLRRFRAITVGRPVVMGRRTFQSIGRPLPGRHNIVLSRDPSFEAAGATVVPNLAEAIAAAGLHHASRPERIAIIGGAAVYAEALPSATAMELTIVHARPEGDTHFPGFDEGQWREQRAEHHPAADGQPAFTFRTLVRVGP